jgi:hypothetical protein
MAASRLAPVLLSFTLAGPAMAQLGHQHSLYEPNVAADTTLARLPRMTLPIAQALRAARPILSAVTLDSILGSKGLSPAQRRELYGRMFVHVDVNRGTDAELLLIPGVDAGKVRVIKAGRPWKSFGALGAELEKNGMSAIDVLQLNQYLFIPINLNGNGNTETDPTFDAIMDTFASIGVGTSRWKHEFKEYRPWTSMDQFNREIGKYVRNNPTELKRLARYVIIDR